MVFSKVPFVKKAVSNPWALLVLLAISITLVILLVYVVIVIPRQSPSWEEQMDMALQAARSIDEDAALFEILTGTPRDFPDDQLFMPAFSFRTPSGQGFRVIMDRVSTMVVAEVKEPVQGTPHPELVELGPEWFHEAAARIQVSPTEAAFISQAAIRDTYGNVEDPGSISILVTRTGSEVEQDYGTRTVWEVVSGTGQREDEPAITVLVTIDAETGEVLDMEELSI